MVDKKKSLYITLGIILILGFSLRIYNLSYQSIWLDEAYSIYHSQQGLMDIITLKDPTPPLYYALLHFWMKFLGTTGSAVRLLSVIFGTASIIIIYLLGKSIFDKEVGIYSAILLALSPLHIYYSQEARTYSLLFLLSLLSMYFYWRSYKNPSKCNITGYLASTILLAYSHFYALFIILAQTIHQLIINKFKLSRKLKSWIFIQSLVFIFYIPWMIQLFSIIPEQLHSWIPRPTALELIFMTYHFFSGPVSSLYGFTLTVICILLIIRYKGNKNKSTLFMLWVTVPVLIPFIYSLIFTPIFTIKYVYFVSLPLYILVSQVISTIRPPNKQVLLLVLIFLSMATTIVQQNTITKDPWNELSGYLQENHKENQDIMIINSYDILPLSYYFNEKCFQSDDIYTCSRESRIYPIDTLEEIKEINSDDLWLIITRDKDDEEIKKVLSYFEQNYRQSASTEYLKNPNSDRFNIFNMNRGFLEKNNLLNLIIFKSYKI